MEGEGRRGKGQGWGEKRGNEALVGPDGTGPGETKFVLAVNVAHFLPRLPLRQAVHYTWYAGTASCGASKTCHETRVAGMPMYAPAAATLLLRWTLDKSRRTGGFLLAAR